jgi:type VI secretion system secreted protein VgrG
MRDAVIALPDDMQASLERFTAHERLSELFVIEAYVLCDDEGTDFYPALGGGTTITVSDETGDVRNFHGLLYESEFIAPTPAGFRHRIVLRPWTYALSRNLNFQIFQSMTAVDIIHKVISQNNGVADLSNVAPRKAREYCVQFRETDFDFISRLMEEEGIYYYFAHKDGQPAVPAAPGRRVAGAGEPLVLVGANLDHGREIGEAAPFRLQASGQGPGTGRRRRPDGGRRDRAGL